MANEAGFTPADIPGLTTWAEDDGTGKLVDRLRPGRDPGVRSATGTVKAVVGYDRNLTTEEHDRIVSYLNPNHKIF